MGIVGVVGQSWEWDVEELGFDSHVLDVVFYGGRGRGLIGSSGWGLMGKGR